MKSVTNADTLEHSELAAGHSGNIGGHGNPYMDSTMRQNDVRDGPGYRRLAFLQFATTRKLESPCEIHSSPAIAAGSWTADLEHIGTSELEKNLPEESHEATNQEQSTHKIDSAIPAQLSVSLGKSSISDRPVSSVSFSGKALGGRNCAMIDADPSISKADNMHEPLSYRIPQDILAQALLAPPGTLAAYWKHSLYRGPPPQCAKVATHYCRRKDASENVAQAFLEKKVLGFDIEWMPQASAAQGIKKNVSLIQFASEERVALFHIAAFGGNNTLDDTVIPTMKTIMENPNIIKVGVGIKGLCCSISAD